MEATCDRETDTLIITLREARIRESDEVRPGVIADFGCDGGVVPTRTVPLDVFALA